jgi:hypothetical protein
LPIIRVSSILFLSKEIEAINGEQSNPEGQSAKLPSFPTSSILKSIAQMRRQKLSTNTPADSFARITRGDER